MQSLSEVQRGVAQLEKTEGRGQPQFSASTVWRRGRGREERAELCVAVFKCDRKEKDEALGVVSSSPALPNLVVGKKRKEKKEGLR